MLTSLLAFIVTLGILVVIHEYGHYRVAVACGVRVLRFSVGFGPVIWRHQRSPDSTEFVVSALPLGGYVRMLDEREGEVPAAQLGEAFNRKPVSRRAAIVAAGPIANLLLAVVLYSGAHWIGTEEPRALLGSPAAGTLAERAGLRSGDWVQATARRVARVSNGEEAHDGASDGAAWDDVRSYADVQWALGQALLRGGDLALRVSDASGAHEHEVTLPLASLESREVDAATVRRIGLGLPFSDAVLGEVKPAGPAARAGLQAGDRVLSVDGQPVPDAARLRELIRASGERRGQDATPMEWSIDRRGVRLTLPVQPAVVDEDGSRFGRIEAVVGAPPQTVTVRYGFIDGITLAATRTWETSALTVRMFGKMLVGEASLKNLSGPLTIADYAGQSARLGLAYYLGFLAVVSISLGILNLVPLPVLDGGQLMYYLFEAVTGRPVPVLWLERLQRGGVAIILMMTSLALYNDVARLWVAH